MKKLITFIVLLLTFPMVNAQEKLPELDTYLDKMFEFRRFTGSVLLAKDDKVIYEKSVGYADPSQSVPNTSNSVYLIGSITKTFTAVAILQLIEDGKVGLNDPLSRFLSDFPDSDEILIKHLLQHRSGIKSYTELPAMNEWKYSEIKPEEVLSKVQNLSLEFEPGTRYSYSNSNYLILGLIIEKISGQAYSEFVQENILSKSEMNSTGMNYNKKGLALSQGLSPVGENWTGEKLVTPNVPFSAGALYSTTGDMLKFSRGLARGIYFDNPEMLKRMIDFSDGFYGLGVYKGQLAGMNFFGHNGGIDGYSSRWNYFPNEDLHLIILSNSFFSQNDEVAENIIKALKNEPIEIPRSRKAIDLPQKKLKNLEGTYELQKGFLVDVYVEDSVLKARASGQDEFELYAENDTSFFAMVAAIDIIFHLDSTGKPASLTLLQAGQKIKAERIDGKRKVLSVDLAHLEKLVGIYELQPGFDLEIYLEDGNLYGRATDQNSFALFAETKNEYFALEAGIEIHFTIGTNGMAESLTLYQGGGAFKAGRKKEE